MCEAYARKLYGPEMFSGDVAFDKPTSAFDNCGYRVYTSETDYTEKFKSSTATSTADSFLNSYGFKSNVMNSLGNSFKIEIISEVQAAAKGVSCLSEDESYSSAFGMFTSAALALSALMLY